MKSRILYHCSVVCCALLVICRNWSATACCAEHGVQALPTTGTAVDSLQTYDRLITDFMQQWRLPGAAVAVGRNGKLALARGYGWANVEKGQIVEPNAPFRLASVSKPITAVAVLALVEQGKLRLEEQALALLPRLQPSDATQIDARFRAVTVEQLLRHSGGWDRERSFDPMFRSGEIAKELGVNAPADSLAVIRYMLDRPLDFTPGERYAYSNFGYCLLGRIVEAVTRERYDAAVQRLVLEPCGAKTMRLGRTKPGDRSADEVCYYMADGDKKCSSVFPDVEEQVAWPDGGFHLEAMDAHGGWIGSAIDLMRFSASLSGAREPRLLKSETVERMLSRGSHTPVGDPTYYALGWMVRPVDDSANWWHSGSLPGTSTMLVHTAQGFDWAILFNSRPSNISINEFHATIDALMWQAFQQVNDWPDHDLFSMYDASVTATVNTAGE